MSRVQKQSDNHAIPPIGTADFALLIVGAVLTASGLALFATFPADARSFTRLLSFVVVPVAIVATYALSRYARPRWLFLAIALLDLEAILVSEIPGIGDALAVAIPLIGVASVTGLLPADRLRLPYLAAWVASMAGVTWGVLTSVEPAGIVPAWTIVPVFAVVDAAALLVLWQINTRRMFALLAANEAERRFRDLLDGVDLLAADIGWDGTIRWANEFGSRLLGVDRNEIAGTNWYDAFVPEERRAEAKARLADLRAGRAAMPRRRESEIVTRSGERRLIRWSHVARHDDEGRFSSLASIGEDITAVREAETAFRQVSELNNALITSSPVPTVVLGLDRVVQLWNPAASEMLGWSADEVLGRPIPNVVPPHMDPATVPGLFREVAAGREARGWRTELRTKDGRPLVVAIYGTALCDPDGKPFAIAAQAIDVTAQEAMEAKLRESQKMEAVGRLAGGVAHDFNNSLTAIGGFAALIAASTDDPEIRQEAESISGAVRRSANLTRELLAYARRSMLQPEALEVNALVGAIRPMLRPLLGEDIQLVIESGVASATIRVDPGQLEQALLNLALNSRDAMPGGGRITIRTGRRLAGNDGVEPGDRPWVTISVTDSGHGIPPDVQSHVFEPFFTTKGVGAGTGLGLAMVHGFVAQSGGRVSLKSEAGVGTTVEIVLPEVVGSGSDTGATPPASAARGGGETILYVEDEPGVAAVGFQILSRRGYRVLLADSGATAAALLRAHEAPIALVLVDVILPDMRGPQVAVAAAASHPEAAVLYTSGYAADAFVARGEMAATVDLLEKPYSPEQLASRVAAAIERRRSETLRPAGE